MAETFTLFWHGPFSQWHACEFEVDGVKYNCAEQYMMAEKARVFGDDESLAKIMEATSPKVQKALGRKVKNFDPNLWTAACKDIVCRGNYAKFSQNPELLGKLFDTRGTTLVEASPYDKIWGIGLGPDNPDAKDRSKWKGTNWLGEVLTSVREKLVLDLGDDMGIDWEDK